jgi:hypothetical protein
VINIESKNSKKNRDKNNENNFEKNENDLNQLPPGSKIISNRNNETILLSKAELSEICDDKNVQVQLLVKDCNHLNLSAPSLLGSVRFENMNNCCIYLGPCCTSVYLEECKDTIIYLSCHQLRIHRSHDCSLYVKVNSHPIIEDCTGLGFAPYNIIYDNIENDFKTSALTEARYFIVVLFLLYL